MGIRRNGRQPVAILYALSAGKKPISILASHMGYYFIFIYFSMLYVFFFVIFHGFLSHLTVFRKHPVAVKGFIGKTEPIQMMPAMKSYCTDQIHFSRFRMAISFSYKQPFEINRNMPTFWGLFFYFPSKNEIKEK